MTRPLRMNSLELATNHWEHVQVHRHDSRRIGPAEAAGILAYVLPMYGISQIPHVEWTDSSSFGHLQGAVASCDSQTGVIRVHMPHAFSTTVLLHEAAHLLVEDPLDRMELRPVLERGFHGPLFYACFLSLLDQTVGRHMPALSKIRLMGSLTQTVPELGPVQWYPTVRGVPKPGL